MENIRKQYRYNLLHYLLLVFCLTACKERIPTKATVARGYVRDEQQKPVEGVTLILTASENSRTPVLGPRGSSKDFAETISDAKGYYEISYLIPKGYGGPLLNIETGGLFNSYTCYRNGKKVDNYLIDEQINEIDWILTK